MRSGALRKSRRPAQRSGAVSVEMALTTPVLFILVFGIIQVGYAFMVQHAIQNAASEGCRTGILPNKSSTDVTSTVNNLLISTRLDQISTTTIQVNNSTATIESAKSGDLVSVQVTVPLSSVTLFPGFFSQWNGTLKGAVSLRRQ
jgi:Flp pilus assembly protein TadG